jgi:hypothetical protein
MEYPANIISNLIAQRLPSNDELEIFINLIDNEKYKLDDDCIGQNLTIRRCEKIINAIKDFIKHKDDT